MDMKSEDFAHPENAFPGLIYCSKDHPMSEELIESRRHLDKIDVLFAHDHYKPEDIVLCWHCGWTAYKQFTTTYASRIKILTTKGNTGTWALGSNWLLKDMPNDGATPGNDYITQKFLRSQIGSGLDIPLCREMQLINQPTENTYLLLMSRVEGEPLTNVWHTLAKEEKERIREQIYQILKQIRTFTANAPQTTEGGRLDDNIIGRCHTFRPTCKKIGSTIDEWFGGIVEELRSGLAHIHKTSNTTIIERELQKLKDNFPKLEPYVLTHGDLTFGNIMVKDAKITAIIDWEISGYYPWWAEQYLNRCFSTVGMEELFRPLWPRLEPCMDHDTFTTEIFKKIAPVLHAWDACKLEHPYYYDKWLRPPFSKDQPWAGKFVVGALGGTSKREHIIIPRTSVEATPNF